MNTLLCLLVHNQLSSTGLIRRKLGQRAGLDVGADVVDAKYKVDWDEATQALSVSEEAPLPVVPGALNPPLKSGN